MQVGFQHGRKRLTQPARGHLRAAGVEEPLGTLREFPLPPDAEVAVGQELTVADIEPGEYVSVAGVSKGRGFAGGVRRWNFRGGPKTHGQSDRHRAPGSVGAGTTPGKVWKGQKMAGHMGSSSGSQLNLLVVMTDPSRNLLFVQGSVPGARSGLVTVTPVRRAPLEDYQPPEPIVALDEEALPTAEESAAEADVTLDEAVADESLADEGEPVDSTVDDASADEEKSGEGGE